MCNLIFRCLIVFILAYFTFGESPRWDLLHNSDYAIDVHHFDLVWHNESYAKIEKLEMVKFNRTFKRVLNASFFLHKEVGTKFSVKAQLYKLFSNHYKFFPLTASIQFCQEYERNSFGLKELLTNFSNIRPCPLKPGYLYVTHLHLDASRFPPLIPAGNYKLSLVGHNNKDKLVDANIFLEITYKVKIEYED